MSAFKTCSKCKRELTAAEWAALFFVGIQKFDDPEIPWLELRNCSCGSTLSIEFVREPNGAWRVAEVA